MTQEEKDKRLAELLDPAYGMQAINEGGSVAEATFPAFVIFGIAMLTLLWRLT